MKTFWEARRTGGLVSRPAASDVRCLAALQTALLAALDPIRAAVAVVGSDVLAPAGGGQLRPADAFDLVLSAGTESSRRLTGRLTVVNGRSAVGAPAREQIGEAPDRDAETRRIVTLVDLARAGDRSAFGELYSTYLDTIYRFILYRVVDVALAEDLTQEVFTRALRRICSFTWQGRDFGAWLITIAKNLVTDHFKASRTRLESATGEFSDADHAEGNPESIVIDAISAANVRAAIKELNPQQQECIELRFLHEFSVAETAAIMGKNEGAIKTLQYRAIRALLKLLRHRPR